MNCKYIAFEDNYNIIYSGGLLIYDDKGIYVIKEFHLNKEFEYTDPGGKFNIDDCDIIKTISREFNEETYFTFEITSNMLNKLLNEKKARMIYTCPNNEKKNTYACILVELKYLNEKINLLNNDNNDNNTEYLEINSETCKIVKEKREEIMNRFIYHNRVSYKYAFTSLEYVYIKRDSIPYPKMSYRIKRILPYL